MKAPSKLTRRDFVKASAVGGAGLVIGFFLPGCGTSPETTAEPTATEAAEVTPSFTMRPNAYLSIDSTGAVTILVHRPEMGQGIRTAFPMIVAEELGADWKTVQVVQAPIHRVYGDQSVGGSTSILQCFSVLRSAGAMARQMLIEAAAQAWDVEPETCTAENGAVQHPDSGRQLTFGELAESAADMSVEDVRLKNPSDFTILGTRVARLDTPQIVDGSATYGIDVKVPGMLYASLAQCPVYRGSLVGYDATQALAVPGVLQVVEIGSGVAVVAENTWAAFQGRMALEIEWDLGANADLNSANIRQALVENMGPESDDEDPAKIVAHYDVPFYAHATPEPMNCVADVREDSCEIWAPTQDPQGAQSRASTITMLSRDEITVHVQLLGGGSGRRLEVDYVVQAVEISKAVGAPIKLTWTREEDIKHDYLHPCGYYRASGNLDRPSFPYVRTMRNTSLKSGAWRSVTNFPEAFVRECFVDEMAAAGGRDPYELRLELFRSDRDRAVLQLAAEKAGWGEPLPDGWGRGMALHATWDMSPTAQVAEVSVSDQGIVRVHRVVCAIDCGIPINPLMIEEQMESAIAWGLTAVLKEPITIENGEVQQSNYHDYPLLRMDEMPAVEVYAVPSDELPTGVGEMGVPPIAPAVLNAVFDATGIRIRHLPIRPEDILAL
ncbi:MAG: xanthine dehydrogenase family protein molybdopterin-binding subunit [Anaerolineales bacterium]|jgi:isoquinoline 1-oxidoreductase beta subunit